MKESILKMKNVQFLTKEEQKTVKGSGYCCGPRCSIFTTCHLQ